MYLRMSLKSSLCLSLSRYIAEVATLTDSTGADFQTEASPETEEEMAQTGKYLANVRILLQGL